jgi:hypothetical protein
MIFTNVGHAIHFPRYTHIKDGMLCNTYMYPYIAAHKQNLGMEVGTVWRLQALTSYPPPQ